jgi:hypothetical protein
MEQLYELTALHKYQYYHNNKKYDKVAYPTPSIRYVVHERFIITEEDYIISFRNYIFSKAYNHPWHAYVYP